MAHDVFISYSNKDREAADAICAAIEGSGIGCWMAPRDVLPGRSYPAEIIRAITASRVLLLVWSSSSNESPQVLREIERAADKRVPILPLRIEATALSEDMEYYLGVPQWLDAIAPPLEQHLPRIAATVARLLGASEPSRPPTPVPADPVAVPLESRLANVRRRLLVTHDPYELRALRAEVEAMQAQFPYDTEVRALHEQIASALRSAEPPRIAAASPPTAARYMPASASPKRWLGTLGTIGALALAASAAIFARSGARSHGTTVVPDTSTATDSVRPMTPATYFVESFDSVTALRTDSNESCARRIVDGTYVIENGRAEKSCASQYPRELPANVRIAVSGVVRSESRTLSYWLYFGSPKSGWEGAYYFLVSGDGEYQLTQEGHDSVETRIPWTAAHSLHTNAGAWNQLAVSVDGAHITLWVNGDSIASYTGSQNIAGYAGLTVNRRAANLTSPSVVAFDDFSATPLHP